MYALEVDSDKEGEPGVPSAALLERAPSRTLPRASIFLSRIDSKNSSSVCFFRSAFIESLKSVSNVLYCRLAGSQNIPHTNRTPSTKPRITPRTPAKNRVSFRLVIYCLGSILPQPGVQTRPPGKLLPAFVSSSPFRSELSHSSNNPALARTVYKNELEFWETGS